MYLIFNRKIFKYLSVIRHVSNLLLVMHTYTHLRQGPDLERDDLPRFGEWPDPAHGRTTTSPSFWSRGPTGPMRGRIVSRPSGRSTLAVRRGGSPPVWIRIGNRSVVASISCTTAQGSPRSRSSRSSSTRRRNPRIGSRPRHRS